MGEPYSILENQPGEQRHQGRASVTIDTLPLSVLLNTFDFCQVDYRLPYNVFSSWNWLDLVHVSRRWRQVIFASPLRLNLQLVCTPTTPAREMLDIWPPLPIMIEAMPDQYPTSDVYDDNLVAVLERRDRVRVIIVWDLSSDLLDKLAAVMLEPLPALTLLSLRFKGDVASALPERFLGNSALALQRLELDGIPFPTLPRLILSLDHLTDLCLCNIPPTGYISPDVMASCLSTLTGLRELTIQFKTPRPRFEPSNRRLLSRTRVVLPALIYFRFKGVSEYLDDLVARIDTPVLGHLEAVFFHQLIFDIPQLSQFSQRTNTLNSPDRVELILHAHSVQVNFCHHSATNLYLHIPCSQSDWQLSFLVQVCGHPLPVGSSVERLDIDDFEMSPQIWHDDTDYDQWLEVLRPFMAVRELRVSKSQAPLLMRALKDLTGERTMEVLPKLSDLYLKGPQSAKSLQETIGPFVAGRQLSGHPVAVRCREGQDWKIVDL
ncbi:hypothetical protein BC827DRAFT_1225990 [Russula dissimulans]|nr:hypothetical protein BC827DRAFT_1225990 [Russula dissimulans]